MAVKALIYEKIIKYVDEHIKNKITLEELSKYSGYSQRHLYKIFRIYSPVPIMEYIRNKRLYAAANEIYSGRKLYDVALDYGYETPAGFYKAFQTVFGCAPSEYKNNNQNYKVRRNIFMNIDHVKSVEELDELAEFFKIVYPKLPFDKQGWLERWSKTPELLLFAKDNDKICAATLAGTGEGEKHFVVDEGILEEYWKTGIFEALFIELEKRAKKLGYTNIFVAIADGQEEFYAKLGYTGQMLIQSEKHSIDDLKNFLASLNNKNAEFSHDRIHDGYINQIWLNVSIMDKKELKKQFEEILGDCWTQTVVGKSV